MNKQFKYHLTVFGASLLLSIFVVLAIHFLNPLYFGYDDGLNEYVPYMTEKGRMLQRADFSTITLNSLGGGNFLIDFERSSFHPVYLLFCLLFATISRPFFVISLFEWFCIFISLLITTQIGISLKLNKLNAFLFSITISFLPVFVFMFVGDWINAAIGTISLLFALLCILKSIEKTRSAFWLFLLGLGVALVLVSGWPHSIVALIIFLLAAAIVSLREKLLSLSQILLRVFVCLLGAGFSFPQISEFIATSNQLERGVVSPNSSGFGVMSLGRLTDLFNPIAANFSGAFAHNQLFRVPLGFVSLLGLFVIFFTKISWDEFKSDKKASTSSILGLVFLFCTQLPENMAFLLSPFRFYQYFAFCTAFLFFHLWQNYERDFSKTRRIFALITFAFCILVSLFRISITNLAFPKYLFVYIFMFTIIALILYKVNSISFLRKNLNAVLVGLSLFFIITVDASAGISYAPAGISYASAEEIETIKVSTLNGYVMVVDESFEFNFGSSRLIKDDVAILNGYEPNRPKVLNGLLNSDNPLPQNGFVTPDTALKLTQKCETVYDLGVNSVIVLDKFTNLDYDKQRGAVLERLAKCGFEKSGVVDNKTIFKVKNEKWVSKLNLKKGTAIQNDFVDVNNDELINAATEKIAITNANSDPQPLNFARAFWDGYSVKVLSGETERTSEFKIQHNLVTKGATLQILVPGGFSGEIELTYLPVSWRFAVPLSIFSIFTLFFLSIAFSLNNRFSFINSLKKLSIPSSNPRATQKPNSKATKKK